VQNPLPDPDPAEQRQPPSAEAHASRSLERVETGTGLHSDERDAENPPLQVEETGSDDKPETSFWDRAAAALAEEDAALYATLIEYRDGSDALEKSLTRIDGDGDDVVSDRSIADMISGVARKQMDDMEHRQWALPARLRGKDTRVRPLLRKILTYANGFKEKADNLIDLDPTGYAKLAWLPFSLVLDVSDHSF
jgi:hypothetical protein